MTNTNAPRPVARPTGRRVTTRSTTTVARASTATEDAHPTQTLTREEAEVIAWQFYATDSPAVVELLLLAHNPDVSTTVRYAANQALTWFDPESEMPEEKLPEPAALRAFRWCVYAYDLEARKRATSALLFHLERWA